MVEIIDTHCHLDNEQFKTDREDIMTKCQAKGISKIVVPAIARSNWDVVIQLCHKYDMLYPALGLHPMLIDQHSDDDIKMLDHYLSQNTVIAVGEIGLDFYDKTANKVKQQRFFDAQLQLAQQYQLPVLLHVRKAHSDVIASLKKYSIPGGIAHAFNGSMEVAQEYIKLGFKLGFGAVVTYERASKIRRLAADLPLQSIVLETDAPDMAGSLHHGERNSPEFLDEALSVLATLRQVTKEEIAAQTTKNARELFKGSL